jgi:hypothetical protein
MNYYRIDRRLRGACSAVMLLAAVAFADTTPTPGNPDTNASDRNYDRNQPNSIPGGLQKMEDGGNRALNKVDEGVHTGIDKTKKGSKKAKKKTEQKIDQLSEPAHEPAKTNN